MLSFMVLTLLFFKDHFAEQISLGQQYVNRD